MMNTETPISRPLRAWLIVEVLFGIGAVLSIGLFPEDTKTNFAWPIQSVVMAAVLGGFYMTSAPLFLLPALARRWQMIRVMILPAAVFSTAQLLATLLHWDKFTVGSTPFFVWFASYLLPPPIFVSAHFWHQRQGAGQVEATTEPLTGVVRTALFAIGAPLALASVIVFAAPGLLIPHFPWPLTPLTARSLSAWLLATGLILLSIARENDALRARLATPMLILLAPAALLQMLRYSSQVNWSNPLLWMCMILFAGIGALALTIAKGSWREALR